MSTPAGQTAPPFFTRRTVLGWAAVAVIGYAVGDGLGHQVQDASGTVGAAALAVTLVAFLMAWVGGAVLAIRRGSVGWLMVALLLGPLGSVLVAITTPVTPAGPTPPRLRR